MSYLSKTEPWRKRLQRAYQRPEYNEARAALEQLHGELEERNQSAAASLEEGLEETLTLHRPRGPGPFVQDDELLGIGQCPRRGKVREGRSLSSPAALVGDGAHRHPTLER